jgi:hypothetical protein
VEHRPLILLDIDGVINVHNGDLLEGYAGHYLEVDGVGGFVAARDDLEPLLHRLAAIGDLMWASGWNDAGPVLLARLIPWLGHLPHLTFEWEGFNVEKLPTIKAVVGDRDVVWLDDLMPSEASAWAAERSARTLLVTVDPEIGLDEHHVAAIEAWARTDLAAGSR